VTWYAVRCLLGQAGTELVGTEPGWLYEERVTLWDAASEDAAVRLAEADAARYGSDMDVSYLGFAQVHRVEGDPRSGTELMAVMRASELAPPDYIRRFLATGSEIVRPRE
jgi:hypothetical protein